MEDVRDDRRPGRARDEGPQDQTPTNATIWMGILPVAGGVVLTWAFVVQSRCTATCAGL
jgi:hypothetical protein